MQISVKKGFTLVELIVVITILAILGTVAFLSFGSYNKTARNAVRLDAVNKLSTTLRAATTTGVDLLAFSFTGNEIPNAQIAGTGTTVGVDYQSGQLNSIAFRVKQQDFQDPLTSDLYLVGLTNRKKWAYEVATIMEEGGGLEAKVVWSYTPRESVLILGTGVVGSKKFLVSDLKDINTLIDQDYVTWLNLPIGTRIDSISRDGTTIQLTNAFTWPNAGISLATNEVTWLILWVWWLNPVINGGGELPYGVSNNTWLWSSWWWSTTCVFGSDAYGSCTFWS